MLPDGEVTVPEPIANAPSGLMLITVHPQHIARKVLEAIDTLIVVGVQAQEALEAFAKSVGADAPALDACVQAGPGQAVIWSWRTEAAPRLFTPAKPVLLRHRHRRKYAVGALGEDKSFYFRGPLGQLKLRAQNLMLFLQIGDGVDDETWLHHLQQHDYSDWVRSAIKSPELAAAIEAIERDGDSAATSRKRVREAIEKIYTLSA
jgi:hypothetical protein